MDYRRRRRKKLLTSPDMMEQKIYSLDLLNNGVPAPFVLRTMEEITDRQKGIAADPERNDPGQAPYPSAFIPYERAIMLPGSSYPR